jgi:hypothetical protein
MSVVGGEAENICSQRAFRLLTQLGHFLTPRSMLSGSLSILFWLELNFGVNNLRTFTLFIQVLLADHGEVRVMMGRRSRPYRPTCAEAALALGVGLFNVYDIWRCLRLNRRTIFYNFGYF